MALNKARFFCATALIVGAAFGEPVLAQVTLSDGAGNVVVTGGKTVLRDRAGNTIVTPSAHAQRSTGRPHRRRTRSAAALRARQRGGQFGIITQNGISGRGKNGEIGSITRSGIRGF